MNASRNAFAFVLPCLLVAASLLLVPRAAFPQAATGNISGTVTSGGVPLNGVTVFVYTSSGSFQTSAFTDANGVYTAPNLPTGSYFLQTSAFGPYVNEIYNNISCGFGCSVTSGNPVGVKAGATTQGINFDLASGGRISGRVTVSGDPLPNVSVEIYTADNRFVTSGFTDANGDYITFSGVSTGTFYARTSVPDQSPYIDQIYSGVSCVGFCDAYQGMPISVKAGATTTGINFALVEGGTIAGTVTRDSVGLSGIVVSIFNSSGQQVAQSAFQGTPSSGIYSVSGLPSGTYYARTRNSDGFIDEIYDGNEGIPCLGFCQTSSGQPIQVTEGVTSGNIDFELLPGGRISGNVTDVTTGLPIQGVSVSIVNSIGSTVSSATTDASGNYTTGNGIPSGTYYATTFNNAGYVNEIYDNTACLGFCPATQGTGILVEAGATTPGINFALESGGRISGTVRNTDKLGIPSVSITVFDASGAQVGFAFTNQDGSYITNSGLPTGTYYVRTSNSQGYINELYNDIVCLGFCTPTNGQGIAVVIRNTTPNIDFILRRGGRISGTITDESTGVALSNVSVNVVDANGGSLSFANTNALGAYTTGDGLPSGSYYIRTSNQLGYINKIYDNVPCSAGSCQTSAGSTVPVTEGTTTANINFSLVAGGRITGTITADGTNAPISNVSVTLFQGAAGAGQFAGSATTNSVGQYAVIGLPAGTYYARTSNTAGFIDERHADTPCLNCSVTDGGTPITVTLGGSTAVDFSLASGGRVAGTVTDALGNPLAGVQVRIFNAAGSQVASATTNSLGAYLSGSGLPTGSYFVGTGNSFGFIDQLYAQPANIPCLQCTVTTGTPLAVTAGQTVANINFALATGGRIGGRVASGGVGLPYVGIRIFNRFGIQVGNTSTNLAGEYVSSGGLPSGQYYVATSNSLGYLDELYQDMICLSCFGDDVLAGQPIDVTAGMKVTGIDFDLAVGGRISGQITGPGNIALASVSVSIFDSAGQFVTSGFTNSEGMYLTSGGLPTGNYFARTFNSQGFIDELFDDASCSSCGATSGTPIAVTAGATTPNVNFALVTGARISGRITDTATGLGIAGVTVSFFDNNGSSVGSGFTNANGDYLTGALASGTYYAKTFNQLGYIDEIYDNVSCVGFCQAQSGSPVVAMVGATTPNISFALVRGGGISGTVRSGSTPLAGVGVQIFNTGGTSVGFTTTNSLGQYRTTAGLPAGVYYARTSNSLGYINEVYDNTTCSGGSCIATRGTPIVVQDGLVTENRDFDLAIGGRISGVVTDNAGAPLQNVSVFVYSSSGAFFSSGTTNSAGQYTTRDGLPTGDYFAITSNSLGYINETYNNVPCGAYCSPLNGQAINVTAGNTTTGINFSLAQGARVSGVIRSAVDNSPLRNVSVSIFAVGGGTAASGFTDANGLYITQGGLQPGQYYAQTSNSLGFIDQQSQEFSVTPPNTTTGIDFTLQVGGRISGRVTNAATGDPIPGVVVQFFDNTVGFFVGSAVAGADGRYLLNRGLATGSYFARTFNNAGFIDERYDNTVCIACRVTEGQPIAVTAGVTTSNIDFALDAGGAISGRITNNNGAPLPNVTVIAYTANGFGVRSGRSDDTGRYEVNGLPPGTYFARTSNSNSYIDEIYDDITCPFGGLCSVTSGTPLTVTQGAVTSDINFSLAPGGRITGRVTDAVTGVAISNARVQVFDEFGRFAGFAFSDGSGNFATGAGLPTGTYFAQASSDGYVRELYSESPCFPSCVVTSGTAIGVTAGNTAAGVNFTLSAGGRITGQVVDEGSGAPLAQIRINVHSANGGDLVTTAFTDGAGRYVTRDGLQAGAYLLRTGNNVGRINELYDNVICPGDVTQCSGGTEVTVVGTATTAGINFALAPGARIRGTITDALTGAPLPNIGVLVFDSGGNRLDVFATTDVNGRYETVAGLPDGAYFVATRNAQGYIDEAYNNLLCPQATCDVRRGTSITISGGASQTGIDFDLVRGGLISGRVTGRVANGPMVALPNVVVEIYGSTGVLVTSVQTDEAGQYIVTGGLATGNYFVKTRNKLGYPDLVYNGRECDPCNVTQGDVVSVTAGFITTGIDLQLAQGALLTGTVFAKDSGVPLKEAPVLIKKLVGTTTQIAGKAKTDENGVYSISLMPGTYYVQSDAVKGFKTQIYKKDPLAGSLPNCPLGLCDPSLGTPIELGPGMAFGQVDLGLDRCSPIAVGPSTLPVGSMGTAYSQTLTATGGTGPYAFAVTSGELPPGLTLNSATGVISGSTAAAGSTLFTISATDSLGCSGTRDYNPTLCSIDIASSSATVSSSAGSGSVAIIAAANDCPWTASSDAAWLTVASSSGSGNASLTYNYQARGTFSASRTGNITISGSTLRVTQSGASATFVVTPASVTFGPAAGSGTVQVSVDAADAPWTLTTNVPWVILGSLGGTGTGTATFTVARNDTPSARSGNIFAAGQTVTIIQAPNGIPGAPENLGARVTAGRARFSWGAPLAGGDATSYVLEAGLAPGQALVNFATPDGATSYELEPTVPPGRFYFRVRGQNEFGLGAASEDYELIVSPDGTNPPGPPLNASFTLTPAGALTVTWSAPATGGVATGYLLEVGSAAGLTNLAAVPVSGLSFSYDGVPPGNYYVRIRALNSAGASDPSNELLLNAGGVPSPPGPPTNFVASASGSTVTLSWQAPTAGAPPTNYVLEAGTGRGLANLATVSVGVGTTVTFGGVPSGTYYLRVRAANAQGASIVSNEVRLVVP